MKKTRLSGLVFFSVAYMWYDERIEHIGFLGIWSLCNKGNDYEKKKEIFAYKTTYDVTFNLDQVIFRR